MFTRNVGSEPPNKRGVFQSWSLAGTSGILLPKGGRSVGRCILPFLWPKSRRIVWHYMQKSFGAASPKWLNMFAKLPNGSTEFITSATALSRHRCKERPQSQKALDWNPAKCFGAQQLFSNFKAYPDPANGNQGRSSYISITISFAITVFTLRKYVFLTVEIVGNLPEKARQVVCHGRIKGVRINQNHLELPWEKQWKYSNENMFTECLQFLHIICIMHPYNIARIAKKETLLDTRNEQPIFDHIYICKLRILKL